MLDLDVCIILVLILLLFYFKRTTRPHAFPPGPRGLPIIGNILQLGKAPYRKCTEWKEKYGPIVGLQLGSYRTVAINDHRMIKEVLLSQSFSGRPDMEIWHHRSQDTQARGIIFTQGAENYELRRIALRAMKEFGYDRKFYENVIGNEITAFIGTLEKTIGEPITLRNAFNVHLLAALWYIVAGEELAEEKAKLSKLYYFSTKKIEENQGIKSVFMFIPWLCKYFPKLSGFNNLHSELEGLWSFLQKPISDHKREYEHNPGVYNDFIGAFLHEMHKDDAPEFLQNPAGEKNLMASLLDFLFAGTDTTANTLHWAFLLLALNPQVQEKLAQEICQVIGNSRVPEMSDEKNMPYTKAFIHEINRYSSIAALAVFHSTMEAVEFHGYSIPKDTIVLLNVYGAHHDKKYWGDPENIRPERFLSKDGENIVKHEAYFPFGMGKRVCVGEAFAKAELFIFLTSVIQKFRVLPDPSNANPSLEPIVTFVTLPPNHKLVFEKRT